MTRTSEISFPHLLTMHQKAAIYTSVSSGDITSFIALVPVVLRRVPPGVVGEFEPIMMAAAESFFADAVVGFMKLSDAEAVDRGLLIVVELDVDVVDESGLRGLERAVEVAVMFGVDVADKLERQ